MANTAQFTAQPILEISQLTTANTNKDGTGTIVTIASGPSASAGNGVGKRINRVTISAIATTTLGSIAFYISLDNGTTNRLILERSVPAFTTSTGVPPFRIEVPELVGLVLPGGGNVLLRASTFRGETFNVLVESGNL